MFYKPLSVDITGRWPLKAAHQIVERLKPETEARGITLRVIDITTVGDKRSQALIVVFCARHDRPVVADSTCDACLLENPA